MIEEQSLRYSVWNKYRKSNFRNLYEIYDSYTVHVFSWSDDKLMIPTDSATPETRLHLDSKYQLSWQDYFASHKYS